MTERPELVTEAMLHFLDTLREGGHFNMYGVGPALEDAFILSSDDARTVLVYWMESYSERHA